MEKQYGEIIARDMDLAPWQVNNALGLLDEGATIPFISRYRKEVTGSLDEVALLSIQKSRRHLVELDTRRESIRKSIAAQGKLSDELIKQLERAHTLHQLEDLYLPYKPKRKTRASVAREMGLEPLARILMKQQEGMIEKKAGAFLSEEVTSIEGALQGARYIIAEWVSENQRARDSMRRLFDRSAMIESNVLRGREEEGMKYKDYFEFWPCSGGKLKDS